ncbi:MAG: hypothetical protein C0483_18115 [Pirellula sp.]|nr:hypothetical protein [Pirellula sp.]
MRHSLLPLSLAISVALGPTLGLQKLHAADAAKPGALPLKKIVLFNSGVGFFEHAGEVTGDASVDLQFNVDDINDLLKSLVPQDLGGGRASTVTYGSMDPITKTLKTFAIDLTQNPTIADLLGQVRGELAELDAGKAMKGTILGVEKRKHRVEKEIIEEEYLNLLTDEGLVSVALPSVQRIRLLNPKLDAELRQALALLATGRSNDKKNVSLRFLGEGKRPVRVSYIQESPVWKTSYRLVLDEEKAPLLQGWAIVENTTEEDWKEVDLTLVSGRPISFVMNLYQPLYISRPLVEPELFASLRPQTYGQDMAGADRDFAEAGKQARERQIDSLARKATGAATVPMSPMAKSGAGTIDVGAASTFNSYANGRRANEKSLSLGDGVQSAAEASNLGELFQYEIETPVALPRQQSAMLPIVAETVKGEKVSIYNAAVHPKHPLNGLRLTNSTKLHLMQGPITVFDAGSYAGDAQIEDLPPGTERLMSYAVDLDTEVAQVTHGKPSELVSMKVQRGVLQISNKQSREHIYTIKNSGRKEKRVLIEYPLDNTWKLTAPEKPTEKTRDRYRFDVAALPGKPTELKIAEEQLVYTAIAITDIDDASLAVYLRGKNISDEVRKAIADVRSRNAAIIQLRTQHARIEQQINIISQEQTRIRQNMQQLDRNSELYQRYVKKFGEQEDLVEKLRAEAMTIQEQIDTVTRELSDFVGGLNVV